MGKQIAPRPTACLSNDHVRFPQSADRRKDRSYGLSTQLNTYYYFYYYFLIIWIFIFHDIGDFVI